MGQLLAALRENAMFGASPPFALLLPLVYEKLKHEVLKLLLDLEFASFSLSEWPQERTTKGGTWDTAGMRPAYSMWGQGEFWENRKHRPGQGHHEGPPGAGPGCLAAPSAGSVRLLAGPGWVASRGMAAGLQGQTRGPVPAQAT